MSHNDTPTIFLGIDVAKDFLQIDTAVLPKLSSVANTTAGIKILIKAIEKLKKTVHVVFEASGGYEQLLKDELHHAEIFLSVVHASRVRHYAKSMGVLAKNDALDASIITRYAQAKGVKLVPCAAPSATQLDLRELSDRRAQLIKMRVMEQNRFAGHRHAAVIKDAKKLIEYLTKQIDQIDVMLNKLAVKDGELQQKVERLSQVKGVGATTALAVLATLPELGTLNRREVASLAGLAPRDHDSGTYRGRRYIKGGRPEARRALYMAAVSASRSNPVLVSFYKKKREQGKPAKVALTAVMRKLLCVMNTLIKNPEFSLA